MNITHKPLLTEAVLFFAERGIAKQMLYAEFEALLDGMVATPEFADETVEAVFVQINNRLHVRAAVFFTLDFDLDGHISPLWNMPLRALAEKAGRGPDMGGGPIRLACLGFCSDNRFKPNLWKPAQREGKADLLMIKEAVTRNTLGILGDDREALAVIQTEHLQMAAEDAWYGGGNVVSPQARVGSQLPEQDKKSSAQAAAAATEQQAAHKEQISDLKRQLDELRQLREVELAAERQRHKDHLAIVQGELHDIKNELALQQKINITLKRDLSRLQNRSASDAD
ncbi:hypothetical protein [Halopseudomonas salina]|uniref:Uncharacterized protein n=1 Tax=Halopseudomonas salina TaxID=1323744 RepID=A0ABQ1Q0T1_9GAMM|nr:hypothetical protein [Halopseudomonas salina]GGD09587.1 hypothetical protein GCM10007418_30790 [Halopseudomonas salina]